MTHRALTSIRAAAAALALVTAALLPSGSATAQSSSAAAPTTAAPGITLSQTTDARATAPRTAKPTIVLVHGAWADASSWTGVAARLQKAGYTVLAPPNPLRSLLGDADYLRAFLSTIDGPVVLVGHSYGGAVITNAATGNPNVKALVYVDAFAPAQGETVNSLVGQGSALTADPTTLFDVRPYLPAPAGDADAYLKPVVFTTSFAQDLPRGRALLLAVTQRPITLLAGSQPSGNPAWSTIPSWYLLGTKDKIITPAAQLAMARRAGSHIVKVRASHVSLITHSHATEMLIVQAADMTS